MLIINYLIVVAPTTTIGLWTLGALVLFVPNMFVTRWAPVVPHDVNTSLQKIYIQIYSQTMLTVLNLIPLSEKCCPSRLFFVVFLPPHGSNHRALLVNHARILQVLCHLCCISTTHKTK